jgi:hypothetical protein
LSIPEQCTRKLDFTRRPFDTSRLSPILIWFLAAPTKNVVSNSHAPFLRRFIDPSMEFYVAQPQLPAAAQIDIYRRIGN